MVLRKDEFKDFVQFKTLRHFTKTHASFCIGTFEDVWQNGCITKKRCEDCGSVAFIDTRTLSRNVVEGYIRKEKLGIELTQYKQDRHEYKFMVHCVSCGQWVKSHKSTDVCPDCSNISSGESGLNYDEFYHDELELWQQGQKHEVNSSCDDKCAGMRTVEKMIASRDTATSIRERTEAQQQLTRTMNKRREVADQRRTKEYFAQEDAADLHPLSDYEHRIQRAGNNRFQQLTKLVDSMRKQGNPVKVGAVPTI